MVSERFPMSNCEFINSKKLTQEIFEESLKYYCCLFDIKFKNIYPKKWFENYLSSSRCRNSHRGLLNLGVYKNEYESELIKDTKKKKVKIEDDYIDNLSKKFDMSDIGLDQAVINNGRIVSARKIWTTITEVDFKIIRLCYNFDTQISIRNFRRYKKGYLPTEFVTSILELYKNKTTLKDVEGKEIEYGQSKEMINCTYGMIVTDIIRPVMVYDNIENTWKEPRIPNLLGAINKYNNDSGRFMFYPWGVWVTAYARYNLFRSILECQNDYLYSDTDSVKFKNEDKHIKFFETYNKEIRNKLIKAIEFHKNKYNKLTISDIEPKTIKGEKKCLGQWNFDGHYSKFKTIGAKRYLVQYSNDKRNKENKRGRYEITVSGLDKKKAIPYMLEKYKENIFLAFSKDLVIPAEFSGKVTHSYIDNERKGRVIDYLGVLGYYYEQSCIHLENSALSLKLSADYLSYMLGIAFMEVD